MLGSPNSASIMGSVPSSERGAASGMRSTFQNAGTSLSVGFTFTLMILGLAGSLPNALTTGLQQHGVSPGAAAQVGALPPVSSLFATILGVNPIQTLLGATGSLDSLPQSSRDLLTGQEFFPHLISGPFHHGLVIVFAVSAGLGVLGAVASSLRGNTPRPDSSAR
jgi:hypothetical protein